MVDTLEWKRYAWFMPEVLKNTKSKSAKYLVEGRIELPLSDSESDVLPTTPFNLAFINKVKYTFQDKNYRPNFRRFHIIYIALYHITNQ